MLAELEKDLADITGFAAVSLQPNAGSQVCRCALTNATKRALRAIDPLTVFDVVTRSHVTCSQGEFAGLRVIQAYHASRGQAHRSVCLIPTSAHGTNPASAALAGLRIVVVKCDEHGNIDVADLRAKAELHKDE